LAVMLLVPLVLLEFIESTLVASSTKTVMV
jgi:hypothetical protein